MQAHKHDDGGGGGGVLWQGGGPHRLGNGGDVCRDHPGGVALARPVADRGIPTARHTPTGRMTAVRRATTKVGPSAGAPQGKGSWETPSSTACRKSPVGRSSSPPSPSAGLGFGGDDPVVGRLRI